MRRAIVFVLGLLVLAIPASGQTRFLVGGAGGYSADNTFFAPEVRVEVPIPHFEFSALGQYAPANYHSAIGWGQAHEEAGRVTGWVNQTSGLTGMYQHGGYTAHGKYSVDKDNEYIHAGYVYKHTMLGQPTRFSFEFLQEIHNGISANGTETDQTRGGAFTFDGRIACFKHGCLRESMMQWAGRVLTQGNPQCDGTFVNKVGYTCPRGRVLTGGFEYKLLWEFPRVKPGHETDLF